MKIPPMAAMEIGTTRIAMVVGEYTSTRRVRITGIGTFPSAGVVRKGQLVDATKARAGVEAAAKQAEEQAKVSLHTLLLSLGGDHIQMRNNQGHVPLQGKSVSRDDMEYAKDLAKEVTLDDDRRVLNTIEQTYTLDERTGIANPEGLRGERLSYNALMVHGLKSRIDDVINVAKGVRFDVSDVVFSGICAALATLSEDEKRNGVLLLNLGGGTTSFVLYQNGVMVVAGCLAVGGDHVTNDIALAFNITQSVAEEIKKRTGTALLDVAYDDSRITLPAELGGRSRTINKRALHTVVNARMDELLCMVRKRLHEEGFLGQACNSVVVTGGGAYLRRVSDLAQQVFGAPCKIGEPINVDGLEAVEQPAAFATVAGLALYGVTTFEGSLLPGWWARFFGKRA